MVSKVTIKDIEAPFIGTQQPLTLKSGAVQMVVDSVNGVTVPNPGVTDNSLKAAPTALVRALGLGIDQTWQNVTGSRVAGTTYTNTTGKPIFVSVYGGVTAVGAASLDIRVDGGTRVSGAGYAGGSSPGVAAIVPAGSTYSFVLSNVTLTAVMELRT